MNPARRTAAGLALAGALAAGLLAWWHPRRVVVEGESMLPTLAPGDRLLVARPLHLRPGQVVALRDPRHPRRLLVKRVSTVLGDAVTVHGDNPAASTDSRVFGPVDRRQVLGAVLRRYGPGGRAGPVR